MGPERSERERERASDAGEAKQAAAACRRAKRAAAKRVRAWVASWAACVAGRRGKEAAGPSDQAARCSRGQAAGTGQREEEGEEGRASWARRCLSPLFFKSNVYQILFSPFSFLSQIQISFEYKFQIF